jgi:hypothetical protein
MRCASAAKGFHLGGDADSSKQAAEHDVVQR